MKNKILYIITTALLISCNSLLEEIPIISQDPETMYVNDATVLSGLNGVYGQLRNIYGSNFTFATDVFAVQGYPTNGTTFNNFIWYPLVASDLTLSKYWNPLYDGIGKANSFIDRVTNMEAKIDTTLKKRVVGEACFIRALNYFYLVRTWGEVPLRINRPVDFKNTSCQVSSIKEIYGQIIDDLKYAELNCWNKGELKGTYKNDIGRVTKLAATTLLAKVYLEMASSSRYSYSNRNDNYKVYANTDSIYTLCKQECDKAIANPNFGLQSKWEDIWNPSNKDNQEYIFSVQYAPVAGQGSSYFTQYVFRQSTYNIPYTDGIKAVTGSVLKLYSVPPFNFNSTLDPRFAKGFVRTMVDRITNDTVQLDESWMAYKIKKSGVVWDPKNGFNVGGSGWNLCVSKWLDPNVQIAGMSGMDYGLLRSADVYLMRAEAKVELSKNPTDGLDDINAIRIRSGSQLLTGTTISDYNTSVVSKYTAAMSTAITGRANPELLPFHEILLFERMAEFTLEGHRWYDLKRLGLLGAITIREGGSSRQRINYYDYYWPYPQDEISFNTKITQKPGY